ncbi:MAG TPA: hypothetical protein VH134_05315 [Candidatus Dormibacteraeota bacterium]|jgi:hypothetical protein|nr:hypothetical protein [Candidatus Dormibacteraeota bacterium]
MIAGGVAAAALAGAGAGLHAHAAVVIPNDVWVDNVTAPQGPFHDDERRLSCAPITVTGARFDHFTGSFEINVLKPSVGRAQQVLQVSWTFDKALGGHQLLDTISGSDIVARATALGAKPTAGRGLHFEFRFLQHHHQHKPFWVSTDCAVKPAAAAPPAPAAAAPVPPASGNKSAALVAPPKTGAGLPYGPAAVLVMAGAGLLEAARRMRHRLW